MLVGFVHGVMNTDNMTISGETIDYGPCAFMEVFDPATVFSSIDHGGRYAYGNQPSVAHWNLARLGEALLPLLDERAPSRRWRRRRRCSTRSPDATTRTGGPGWRRSLVCTSSASDDRGLAATCWCCSDAEGRLHVFVPGAVVVPARKHRARLLALPRRRPFGAWAERWQARVTRDAADVAAAADAMDRVNPIYIPRNEKVEEALAAATGGDLEPFRTLLEVVREPFTERPGLEAFTGPAPPGFAAAYCTYCGT